MQKAIELLEKRRKHWVSIKRELVKKADGKNNLTVGDYVSYYNKEEHESIVKTLKFLKSQL